MRLKLTALDSETFIEYMNTRGWRLHSLKGNRAGLWELDVSKNWHIGFKFSGYLEKSLFRPNSALRMKSYPRHINSACGKIYIRALILYEKAIFQNSQNC
ncbi:hypothetical protein ACFL0S_02240 [Thermodesulfobacteriota bacterium]